MDGKLQKLQRQERVLKRQETKRETAEANPQFESSLKDRVKHAAYVFGEAAKKVIFEQLSVEEKKTLARKARTVKDAYKDSYEARQARPVFETLLLTEKDVTKFYNTFLKVCIQVDPGIDDRVGYGDWLHFLDLDHSGFNLRFYRSFDTGKRNQFDFKTFVTTVWTYCMLSEGSMMVFLFDLYDVKNQGIVFEDELQDMVRDMYGNRWEDNEQAKKLWATLDKMTKQTIGGYGISIDMFCNLIKKKAGTLLFPAFEMQRKMRARILGEGWWQAASLRAVTPCAAGLKAVGWRRDYLDTDVIMRLHARADLARAVAADGRLRRDFAIAGMLEHTGSKIKRHQAHLLAAKQLRAAQRWQRLTHKLLKVPPKIGGKGGRYIKKAPALDKYKSFKSQKSSLFKNLGAAKKTTAMLGKQRSFDDALVAPSGTLPLSSLNNSSDNGGGGGMAEVMSFEALAAGAQEPDLLPAVASSGLRLERPRAPKEGTALAPLASPIRSSSPGTNEEVTIFNKSHSGLGSRGGDETIGWGNGAAIPQGRPATATGAVGRPSRPAAAAALPRPKTQEALASLKGKGRGVKAPRRKPQASGYTPTNFRPSESIRLGANKPPTRESPLLANLGGPTGWSRPPTAGPGAGGGRPLPPAAAAAAPRPATAKATVVRRADSMGRDPFPVTPVRRLDGGGGGKRAPALRRLASA